MPRQETAPRYARSRCDGELAAAEILVRAIQLAGKDFRSCGEAKSLLAWLMRSVHISCSDVQRGPPRDPTGS